MMRYIHYKSKKQNINHTPIKLIALILCACFIVVSFMSTSFIIINADHGHGHDCPNGKCKICSLLSYAENLLKQLSPELVATTFTFFLLSFILFLLIPTFLCVDYLSLVELKVRLDY